ncbi:MAG: hypothetical protein JST22_11065 [Bacteroidetes bacterium]|nr:hypothetical protein [Bacteroidota bacterium]
MSDAQPYLPSTDYFFLGNGRIMVAIQWSRDTSASPYGILLCDPERMSRKNGSLLFHPEMGLARTMLTVVVDGVRYQARHDNLQVKWSAGRNNDVVAEWQAGPVRVSEQFAVPNSSSVLLRDVGLVADEPCDVQVEAALYANPLYFDEFGARPGGQLFANGYASIDLYSIPTGRPFERFLTVKAQATPRGSRLSFVYAMEAVGTHEFTLYPNGHLFAQTDAVEPPQFDDASTTLEARMMRQHRIARTSLKATVSVLGKFDAAIWQYDFEWGMDAAMVALAASVSGEFELARAVLLNILQRLSNPDGMIMEASRFRGGEMAELNGNGAVLDALWHYWQWSGDHELLATHWPRITAITEYPLREEFTHSSGLLRGRRDLWERTPWMGVQEGFELGHQTFCAVGLRRAADMAKTFGTPEERARWQTAADGIATALVSDPTFALVDNDCLIRRRLIDGSVQRTLKPDHAYHSPDYLPYVPVPDSAVQEEVPWEPDVVEALPILYGLVAPSSVIAWDTLETLEALWNPTGIGGYARYNVAAEADSPGPWPFATAFMAAAQLTSGNIARARRSIEWLLDMAGAGGSWFEFYGERATPPLPPVGVIVWGWAQFLILMSRHVVGAEIVDGQLRIAPAMSGITQILRLGGHYVTVNVDGLAHAELDGSAITCERGTVHIPLPLRANHLLHFQA